MQSFFQAKSVEEKEEKFSQLVEVYKNRTDNAKIWENDIFPTCRALPFQIERETQKTIV
jgi:hypothetical protein